MKRLFLICNEPGLFSYFEEPDETGIVGMFTHINGTVTTLFGSSNTYIRHYVTLEQLKQTDWFEEFLKQWEEEMNKELERMNRDFEIAYSRDYWMDIEEEELRKRGVIL